MGVSSRASEGVICAGRLWRVEVCGGVRGEVGGGVPVPERAVLGAGEEVVRIGGVKLDVPHCEGVCV